MYFSKSQLKKHLESVFRELDADETSYYVCAGKIERYLRDKVAFQLYRKCPKQYYSVCTEYSVKNNRYDLVVLRKGCCNSKPRISLMIEFKMKSGVNDTLPTDRALHDDLDKINECEADLSCLVIVKNSWLIKQPEWTKNKRIIKSGFKLPDFDQMFYEKYGNTGEPLFLKQGIDYSPNIKDLPRLQLWVGILWGKCTKV